MYIYFTGGKISAFIIVNSGTGWRGVILSLFSFLKRLNLGRKLFYKEKPHSVMIVVHLEMYTHMGNEASMIGMLPSCVNVYHSHTFLFSHEQIGERKATFIFQVI